MPRPPDHQSLLHQPSASPTHLPTLSDYSALVVEPSLEDLLDVVSTISTVGMRVTAAGTFSEAKSLISSHPPTLLVAAIRLGMYNGLHLVVRGKAVMPEMAALVTSAVHDSGLQADAEAVGATFVVKPISEREFLAAILQTLFRRDPQAGPIRAPFERRSADRRALDESFTPERRTSDRRRLLQLVAPQFRVISRTGSLPG